MTWKSIPLVLNVMACAFFAPILAHAQKSDYIDLDAKTLTDLIQERSKTQDPERVLKLDAYLNEKATPRNPADLMFLESELTQNETFRRHRALAWLTNIHDPKMSSQLYQFFKNNSTAFPPSSIGELAKHPEKFAREAPRVEVLGAVMLKLADLNVREAIPQIREYATAEGDLRHVRTDVGAQAIQALAGFKDVSFFGLDKRDQLRARYVDFSDPRTKPWLMDTMENDKDQNIRLLASEAWVRHAADPEDPTDVAFAVKLANTPRGNLTNDELANRRGTGLAVMAARVAGGHHDVEILNLAVRIAKTPGDPNREDSAKLLAHFNSPPDMRERALKGLTSILTDSNARPDARWSAQRAIGRITGKWPHYDGEAYCDQHPKTIGNSQLPPKATR